MPDLAGRASRGAGGLGSRSRAERGPSSSGRMCRCRAISRRACSGRRAGGRGGSARPAATWEACCGCAACQSRSCGRLLGAGCFLPPVSSRPARTLAERGGRFRRASLPGPDILQDFDTIRALNPTPPRTNIARGAEMNLPRREISGRPSLPARVPCCQPRRWPRRPEPPGPPPIQSIPVSAADRAAALTDPGRRCRWPITHRLLPRTAGDGSRRAKSRP